MEPGKAGAAPPVIFPEQWCGLWKDGMGRVMYIRRMRGRQVLVSFAGSVRMPCFPLRSGGATANLSGVYAYEEGLGPVLRIDTAPGEVGVEIQFSYVRGDRLRYAEPSDLVALVIAIPFIPNFQAGIDWLLPLSNYSKADEDAHTFLACHPLIGH
jgi:hypothetical protein